MGFSISIFEKRIPSVGMRSGWRLAWGCFSVKKWNGWKVASPSHSDTASPRTWMARPAILRFGSRRGRLARPAADAGQALSSRDDLDGAASSADRSNLDSHQHPLLELFDVADNADPPAGRL